jgi:hypothetical protein
MAKAKKSASSDALTDLLYQSLETELGGVEVYNVALECAQNDELREEWEEYLEQTEHHVEVIRGVCEAFGLDPEKDTPGRKVVRHIGEALVESMRMALKSGTPEAAELVACECVVLAETKDHMNWSLLGQVARTLEGANKESLTEAHGEVEDEEDEHLYHTTGWARELWFQALGLPSELPPPEEEEDVESAEEAAQVKEKSVASRSK